MNKILVIVDSIDPNHSSGAKGRLALIKNFVLLGYELKVIHNTELDLYLEGAQLYKVSKSRFTFLAIMGGFQRLVQRKTGWNLNSQIEGILGFSFRFFQDVKAFEKMIKSLNWEPNFVITLTFASSFRPHKAMLNVPKWHDRWLAYVHDPFPMHSYPRPYDWVEPGHQKKRDFFLSVCEKARWMAYPSLLLQEWMESYYPPARGKGIVIPHQANKLNNKDVELPEWYDTNRFIVLHAGSMMSARNPMTLVHAFVGLLNEIPVFRENASLVFVGPESIFDQEIKNINRRDHQIVLHGSLPFSMVLAMQREASVNVILEAKGPISPFLPGKFAHALQSDRPMLVLGPYYSEVRRLLGTGYPWVSEIDDEQTIRAHVYGLFIGWMENGKKPVSLGRKDLEVYLGPDHLRETLDSLS